MKIKVSFPTEVFTYTKHTLIHTQHQWSTVYDHKLITLFSPYRLNPKTLVFFLLLCMSEETK